MKRRILSIVTALALCLSLCPTWAFAWEEDTADMPAPIDGPIAGDVARVEKPDGATSYVSSLADAFVAGNDGATVTLLGDNCAYYQNGRPIALADLPEFDEEEWAAILTGPVTVGVCEHTGVSGDSNDDGTHTLTCPYCGYTEAAADCTYGAEYQHDDTHHWLTCTVCRYENKEAHDWGFDSASSGNVIENHWVCFGCERTKDHLTLTITVPDGLTYGNTEGKQVTCTVSPETTCDKVTWRFTGGSWPEFADGILPAGLSVGEHWFRVEGLMSDDTIVFSGSYYLTVSAAPLTGDMVTLSPENATYNGTEQKPTITVKQGETTLAEGTDYDVAYSTTDFTSAGTVTITVTGKGNYDGKVEKTYIIAQATPTIAWSSTSQELTYTGNPAAITAPAVTLVNGETFSGPISYSYTGTSSGNGLPTDAGTYTITAKIDAEGNYAEAWTETPLTLTITPALVNLTFSDQIITYGDTPAPAAADPASAKIEYSYTTSAGGESISGWPANVGTYTVTAEVKASGNYGAASATAALTIHKASLTITGAEISEKEYNGGKEAAVSGVTFSGLVNGETLELGTDYTATGEFADAGVGESKSVAVAVTLLDTTRANNYTLTNNTFTATGKIKKADSIIATPPTATGITYGQALSDSTLSGGAGSVPGTFAWTDGTARPNAGTAQYSVTFTPTDEESYNTATANVSVTVAKATPTLTLPTASAIEYGQKLSDSTLTGGSAVNPNGSAAVAGRWSWANGNTQPTAAGTFPVKFVPGDTANYNIPENVDTSVTVNPAAPKITLTVPASQAAGREVTVNCIVENPHDAAFKEGIPEAVTLTYQIGSDAPQAMTGTSFTVPAGTAKDTVITITASTAAVDGKYTAAAETATVTVTDKISVTISGVTAQDGTYNGSTHSGYIGKPTASPYSGDFIVTYAGRNGTSCNSTTPPTNAGDYTVTISLAETDTYIGSLTLDFTIGKASIIITADNKQADAGAAKPALTYTVDGLADGDALAAAPTLTCDADMDTIGSYPITASGAAVPGGGNYHTEITYVPGMLTVTDPAIHVTGVTLNKASLTLTVGSSERLTAAVAPGNATDKSVTWTSSNTGAATVDAGGNVTAVSAGAATITVTTADGSKTATCAVTVNNPGSSPSGDDGDYVPSDPCTPTSAVTVPVSGDADTVRISASVSGSTATVSKIDTTQLDSVIGGSAQTGMVEIDFTGLGKTIDTVKLPTAAIAEIAAAAQDKNVGGLTIKLSNSEISFNGDALAAIQAQAGSQITLAIIPAKASDLNTRQKETVGSAPVYDLTLQSDGRTITDFRGGYAAVSLPYTLTEGQNPDRVVVCYLDSTGNITPCATIYDARNQSAIFTTGHLSLYFVDCDTAAVWANPFPDVAENAWYYDAVRFVNQNGLMNGYGNGTFGPNDYLSRAMLAQILYNRAGKPAVTGGSVFTDVAPGQWYTNAVIWANQNGIVSGYGSGLFGPNDNITREQLAVMLWRYAGSPAAADEELNFTDAGEAGGYALEALRWAVENGVINGYGDGWLGSKGPATRAQAAQMLTNFLKGQ